MKSMTGFGKFKTEQNGRVLTVELKSVNNRFLDINCKMPRSFFFLEYTLRKMISKRVGRGRIDVFLTYEDNRESDKNVNVDMRLASGYVQAALTLKESFNITDDFSLSALLKMPDVIKPESVEEDCEALQALLTEGINGAITEFEVMREREGKSLKADIESRLFGIENIVNEIHQRAPLVSKELVSKLSARIKELLAGVAVDEEKLLNEAAFYADRVSIDEEIARLHSHISQMRKMLSESEGQGRKLDFIIQEFNREANTICSKSNDSVVTELGLNLKSEIEKIREQVQNIE